ncbi:hypothetical protein KUV57_11910 [Epibacterium sp. DP7N7-1]|nr:hypothetical protein [Epibacterium sp. DP7N7-1]
MAVHTTGRIIKGPWLASTRDQSGHLSLIKRDGTVLETFTDYESVITYREREELGEEWILQDTREEPSEKDRMMLLGMIARDHLKPIWRRAQFDRLLHGEIARIPNVACEGLHDPSTAVIELALHEAGHTGWAASYGQVARPEGTIFHAWIEHENGTIVDFMADRFLRCPVSIVSPQERDECGYGGNRSLLDFEPDAWLLDLPQKIEEVFPLEEGAPEFAL